LSWKHKQFSVLRPSFHGLISGLNMAVIIKHILEKKTTNMNGVLQGDECKSVLSASLFNST